MRKQRSLAYGLLSLQAVLLAWSGYRHSPTVDEPAHLAAGISHCQHGLTDLYAVNPPLVRMVAAVPVLFASPKTNWLSYRAAEKERAEFRVGDAFVEANGPDIFRLMTLARWGCIPLVLLGGWVCWRWASELFGPASGMLALLMWCVSPNILAHGSLITADAASASVGLTAAWLFWHWLKQRTVLNALAAGVALGVALLVKSTLIVFCGLWPLLWLLYRIAGREDWQWRPVRHELAQGALVLATAILCLNLGYGFQGSFRRLDSFRFVSGLLTGHDEFPGHPGGTFESFGNRFEQTFVAALRVPVPANFLIGIDRQRKDFERGRSKYFLGRRHFGDEARWWWFYLYAASVKVPLGTWLLGLLALPLAITRRNRDQLPVLLPGLVILVLVSSQTGLSYFRYLLPAFGFAFVWISQAAVQLNERRPGRWLVFAAAGWMTVSSLWVYPHSLSYFNELAGGPQNGFRVMNDSNQDWGQDLLYLRDWIAETPSARGLVVRYFGDVDLQQVGIDCRIAGKEPDDELGGLSTESDSHWYAVSTTHLTRLAQNGTTPPPDATGERMLWHRSLYNREPDVRIGYSIHVYRTAD